MGVGNTPVGRTSRLLGKTCEAVHGVSGYELPQRRRCHCAPANRWDERSGGASRFARDRRGHYVARPKRVEFIVDDGWGTKQFAVDVTPADIAAAVDDGAPQRSR